MAEEQEQEDNYNSFPYESFIEDQIFIDYEDEEYEERDSEITTEMAERETEITETETETSNDEQTETYILCHICEGHFSANNSTTTLERHLKAKHFDVYKDLGQVESNAKPWTVDIQQEKHNLFFDHFVLDVLYIPSPHTALAIKDSIIKIVLELNIADRLIGITSDNEAKMLVVTRLIKEDLNLSEFCHYHCAAHILNLAVEAALNTNRALEIKPLLAHLVSNLTSLSNNWPNEEEWNILTILADLLAPFASVTRVISASSYPTIGEVKLLFEGIRMHLNQSRGENFILQDQVDEMNRVFTNYFDEINEALHVPAFFDPRYKKLAYGDMSQNNIFEPIRRAMANYRESDDTHIPSQPIQASQRHLMNLSAIETRNFFRNLIAPNQTPQPVLNELELYFTSNSPGNEIVPLEW
ncbi:unnamed protein product [Rhizophagus irregularis]|nr:unnamed protein product [Rhizophagus irregularis]